MTTAPEFIHASNPNYNTPYGKHNGFRNKQELNSLETSCDKQGGAMKED
jgi:hypothetical protein